MNDRKSIHISKRLDEVLAVKDSLDREVVHLPVDEALAAILEKAHEAAKECSCVRQAALRKR